MRRSLVFTIFTFLLIGLMMVGTNVFTYGTATAEEITIFHAGSLSIPFSDMEKAFEKEFSEYDVVREAAGSRTTARKVTELGRKADVVASADYTVIKNLMMPQHTEWYVNFATNEMAIMYTPDSKYAEEINEDTWYQILLRPEVEYGHSDPDADPCGYRSQLVWKLAEKYYSEPNLYSKLDKNCPSKNVRPKETDLLALLEAGELDYIFIYRSVAQQHGMPYLLLPEKINLKTNKYTDYYSTATYEVSGKEPGETITQRGKPMVYGVTIPKTAPNREGGIQFLKFLISDQGQRIMADNGQPPLDPAVTNSMKKAPAQLESLLKGE